jgi:hypothetical protein
MSIPELVALVVLSVLLTAVGVIVVHKTVYRHVQDGHNEVLVPLFLTAGTIYAVFLAFVVVAVWEANDAARLNAADEASTLSTLYRGTTGITPAAGQELRQVLRAYTEAVVVDEWTIQAKTGGVSPKARRASLDLFQVFQTASMAHVDPSFKSMVLTLATQIQSDRNKRTLQAGESLSPAMWITTIGGGILVLFMGLFLFMENLWPHILMQSILALIIASLLCVAYFFSTPFSGPLALHPDSFEHSLSVFSSVDQMNR